MTTLLWSALAAVGLVEILALFFRLDFWRRRANALEFAALTFAEAPDDQTQERLVLSAAWNLLALVFYVWAVLALCYLLVSVVPNQMALDGTVFLWTTSGAAMAYAWLRAIVRERRVQSDASTQAPLNAPSAGYNRIARWLHWMALEIGLIRSASFELEKALYLRKASRDPRIADQPVYVMGLARSGTTVVLEILEKTGAFHSPTYRDMPFVLCPNLWNRLTRHSRLKAQLAARAHGDGIIVGFDSPESFEEVFWRTACESRPGPALAYEPPNHEVMSDFAAYRQLSVLSALPNDPLQSTTLRYLSKNNNNVLRLQELSSQAGAHVVLIIRDPLATAWSLYRQHQRFSQMQADDVFVRAYMRWLGHHEFGRGHKPLATGAEQLLALNPQQPDYWLTYWIGIYENLWQTYRSLPLECQARIAWMSHEHMCQSPASELARLFRFARIQQTPETYCSMLKQATAAQDLEKHFDIGITVPARALHQDILGSVQS